MAEPVTFEEAVDRVQAANPHLSHAEALHYLADLHSQGDPEVMQIPDIRGKLANAAVSSFTNNLVAGIGETLGAPFAKLSDMVGAATDPKSKIHQAAEQFSGALEKAPEEVTQTELPGYAGKAGRFIGQTAGTTGLLEGTGIGAAGRALPWIGDAVDAAGKPIKSGLAKIAARGALENTALQQLGALGNMSPGDAATYGAIAPVALRGVARVFGLGAEDAAVKGVTDTGEEPTEFNTTGRNPVAPAAPARVDEPTLTRQGEYEPNLRATMPPEVGEPKPLGNVRKGQPFQTATHTRNVSALPGITISAPQDHAIYGKGAPYPRTFNKPMVVDVPGSGPEGWTHAAESLYANNPRVIQRLADASDPDGFAQLLVARAARKAGYDSVSLNSARGLNDNIIMDLQDVSLKDINSIKHPDLSKELFQFQKQPLKAAAVAEEVFTPKKGKAVPAGASTDPFEPARPEAGEKVHASGDPELAKKVQVQVADMAKEAGDDPDALHNLRKQGLQLDNPAVLQPEVQEAVGHVNRKGRLGRFLPTRWLSNRPIFNRSFQATMEQQYASNNEARILRETYGTLRKEAPELRDPEQFDEIARATDGYVYEADEGYKTLKQSAINVSRRHNEIAQKLAGIRDRIYSFLTGNDPRVPYVLERHGLSHNRWQLDRLRAAQTDEGLARLQAGKRPLDANELYASRETKGMLNYNFTHDLDWEPFTTGWLKFHPHENEHALIADAIKHVQSLKANYKDLDFPDQERLQELLQRNEELTDADWKRQNARAPITDFQPRRKWVSMLHKEGHPAFYSKDTDEIVARMFTSVTNKRIADVNLAFVNRMVKDETIPGPERDLYAEWANLIRGTTGYAADKRTADTINGFLPAGHEITAHDVHHFASSVMEWNSLTKLHLSQIRFPLINLTHLFVTAMPTAGVRNFGIGMARTLANPAKAMRQAVEAGLLSHDSEWVKEIGDVETKLGRLGRPLRYTAWMSENFRKAAAYQIGLASAERGEYSPVVAGFVHDPKAYSNLIQMQRAYARAFVGTTQFELGNVDKPLAFGGSGARRIALQFRSWQSNLGGLYRSMWHNDKKAFAKGVIALGMLGGARAVDPFPGTYDAVRQILLRTGVVNLPQRPGYHYALGFLGLADTPPDRIEIQSLRDPFGTDPYGLASFLGPTFGSIVDVFGSIHKDLDTSEKYKIPRDLIHGVAPQLGDMIDGASEILTGGVVGKGGVIDSNRSMLSKVLRGIDLQQSYPAQQSQYEHDLEQAIDGGNPTLINQIRKDYESRGIQLDAMAGRRIKAYEMRRARARAHVFSWSDLQ